MNNDNKERDRHSDAFKGDIRQRAAQRRAANQTGAGPQANQQEGAQPGPQPGPQPADQPYVAPQAPPPIPPSNPPKRNVFGNILDNIKHPIQMYKRHPIRNSIIGGAAVLLLGGIMIHGCHGNKNNNYDNGSSIRQEQNIEQTLNVYQADAKKRRSSTQVSDIYANSWSEKLEALFRYYTQDELDSLRAHSKNIQDETDKLGLAVGATQITFGKNPQTKKDNTITNIQFGISMYKIMGYHTDPEMRKYRKGKMTDRKTDDERVNFYERYFDYAEKSAERNDKTALTYIQQTLPRIVDEFNYSEYDKTQPNLYSRFTKLKQTIIDATDSTKTAAATKRK
jgi:hypothetical protein